MKRVKKPKRERSTFTWKENRQICQDASRISMLLLLAALTDTRLINVDQVKEFVKIIDEEEKKLEIILNDYKLSKVRKNSILRYYDNLKERMEKELLQLKVTEDKMIEVMETSVLYSQHLDNHLVKLETIAKSIEKQTGVKVCVKGWGNGKS